jgi:hypothetical protein
MKNSVIRLFLLSVSCIGVLLSKVVLAGAPLYPPPPPSYDTQKGVKIVSREELPAELRQREEETLKKLDAKGYLEVSDTAIDGFEKNIGRSYKIVSLDRSGKRLTGKGQINSDRQLESVLGEPTIYKSKSHSEGHETVKIFRGKYKEIVSFKERDLTVAGMQVTRERINADVNGLPAILVTLKSKGGGVIKSLTWWTEEKMYRLEYVFSSQLLEKVPSLGDSVNVEIKEMAKLVR